MSDKKGKFRPLEDITLNVGDIEIGAVEIKNATDDTRMVVDSDGANVSVKKSVLPTGGSTANDNYPSGTGTDTSVTLTNATTAYAVISSTPTKNYLLTLYNGSDTDMYIRESTGTTVGFLLPAGGVYTRNMGANAVLYAYCGSAGKVLNVSYRLIN